MTVRSNGITFRLRTLLERQEVFVLCCVCHGGQYAVRAATGANQQRGRNGPSTIAATRLPNVRRTATRVHIHRRSTRTWPILSRTRHQGKNNNHM